MHLPHIFAIATAAFASFAVAAPAEPGEQCLLICWAEEHECEAPSYPKNQNGCWTCCTPSSS
ncbi:hypothetical protein ASPSYDRAFT_42159 [Aspergillus sydowii CBS 593.65]|uniref:Uncharacterized protein n=1 Tax=Aspergillus sydowii CBS 593.65 TaxID=1036612 RepID=A0A1L9TM17_9EURO|nr:uncharacterized protein ASPSYDRAFT_42159 [Aspergillus sydowii CBS 593.65]OJJ60431.1 hypothetical protein ASPSYDRAFT_42159 [Aspergillus sydowii CBS 593.65]